MKACFICDTPYQILNCINYVFNEKRKHKIIVDIYIGRGFENALELFQQLKKFDIFDQCYTYDTMLLDSVRGKIRRLIEIKYPERHIKRVVDSNEEISMDYDQIWCSMPTHFAVAMILVCNNAKVMYFDDGTGSYCGNINMGSIKASRRFIYRVLGKDLRRLVPETLYVNNPELCKSEVTDNICALPSLKKASTELWEIIESVFNYHKDGYYTRYKLINLLQPIDNLQIEKKSVDIDIADCIKNYKEYILVRPHPRQNEIGVEEFEIDMRKDMWELVCADQITDNHVLLGLFSTAQFVPKLIYGKEPFLIFTYQLYGKIWSNEKMAEVEKMISDLKVSYRLKQKVMIPKDMQELENCLQITMQQSVL